MGFITSKDVALRLSNKMIENVTAIYKLQY